MPRISEKRIFNIIGSLYDIAQQVEPNPWIEVYKDMAELFKSGPGALSAFDKREEKFRVLETTVDGSLIDEYFDHYQYISPLRADIATLKPGERFNREQLIDDESFRNLPIYEDFYKRCGVFHLEYRVFLHHDGSHAGISFTRRDRRPNFSINESLAMTYLMPHLARTFKLHFNLLDVHRQNRVISDAFDRIPQAVIVLDRERKLVFANARGSELLKNGDALMLNAKGAVDTRVVNTLFERLLADMFDRRAFEADKYGGVTTVERNNGLRPLELLISPFKHEDFGNIGSESLAIIFVTDPEAAAVDAAELLTKTYGLTPTEARLARLLAEDRSFSEACAEMSISENTGRTHLKRIFSKTDTNRQSALIKLTVSGSTSNRQNSKKD